MSKPRSSVLMVSAALIAAVSLGGCATKKYVNETASAADTRLTARADSVDQVARDALARADAAGKLAEGKFVYSMVLSDDSMKFPAGKATLTPEAQARLDAFVDKLKADNRNVYVEVQGHTDASEGSKQTAYRLGEQRAEAVRRYLNEHGVALNRIGTISYGADAPAAPARDRASRQANRRVVLIVLT